ncbi:MAG TPA: hypothetical protein VM823_11105, partial [Gaiellales bacterium]|nr:hypothetical protein [Gaiellales bacterium]
HSQPVAAVLYGLGLGAGFGTYLPVATLVVVAAGVLAFAGPWTGAVALAAFGLGRGLVLAVSTARLTSYEGASCRVESMIGWGGRLRRVNALALAALATLLLLAALGGTAQAATRLDLGSDTVADPAPGDGGIVAFNQVSGGTVTGRRLDGALPSDALPGTHPDIDGGRIVVDTGPAFQILNAANLNVQRTLPVAGTDPALSGDWLVYRRRTATEKQIVLLDLTGGDVQVLARAKGGVDLGPPDISEPRIVWTRTDSRTSRLVVHRVDTGGRFVRRQATRSAFAFASIDGIQVAFVRFTLHEEQVLRLNLSNDRMFVLVHVRRGSGRHLWSTAVDGFQFYFTRYTATQSFIYRV